jgi:hypothetical protein
MTSFLETCAHLPEFKQASAYTPGRCVPALSFVYNMVGLALCVCVSCVSCRVVSSPSRAFIFGPLCAECRASISSRGRPARQGLHSGDCPMCFAFLSLLRFICVCSALIQIPVVSVRQQDLNQRSVAEKMRYSLEAQVRYLIRRSRVLPSSESRYPLTYLKLVCRVSRALTYSKSQRPALYVGLAAAGTHDPCARGGPVRAL